MPLNNFGVVLITTVTTPTTQEKVSVYRSAQPDAVGFKTMAALGIDVDLKLSEDKESSNDEEKKLFNGQVIIDEFPEMFRTHEYDHVIKCIDTLIGLITAGKNILIHCSHGRDRTGLISGALKIIYCGCSYDEAQQDRRDYGANAVLDWTADAADLVILKKIAATGAKDLLALKKNGSN